MPESTCTVQLDNFSSAHSLSNSVQGNDEPIPIQLNAAQSSSVERFFLGAPRSHLVAIDSAKTTESLQEQKTERALIRVGTHPSLSPFFFKKKRKVVSFPKHNEVPQNYDMYVGSMYASASRLE